MSWKEGFLSGKSFGEHGNAWDDELTGVGGFSKIVDTRDMAHISIMGEIDADTEIGFWASQDGVHFYFCARITETIGPVSPIEPLNKATDPSQFSASSTDTGSAANLAEGESGLWQINTGGDMSGSPEWVAYDMGGDQEITAYSIRAGDSFRAPVAWNFQGHNGSDWVTIETQTGIIWSSSEAKSFVLSASVTYEQYRLELTQTNHPNRTRLDEVRLLQETADTPVFPKQFHIYPTVGGRYIRLRSSDNVTATVTIAGKP